MDAIQGISKIDRNNEGSAVPPGWSSESSPALKRLRGASDPLPEAPRPPEKHHCPPGPNGEPAFGSIPLLL